MPERSPEISKALSSLGLFLQGELRKELVKQGKRVTNALYNSIRMEVTTELNRVKLTEKHIFYGDFVDRGRKPGVKRVPIEALERWLRQKGFEPTNTRGVAFAIQKKIFEKGIKPTFWLTGTLKKNRTKISQVVQGATFEGTQAIVNDILARTNARLAKL